MEKQRLLKSALKEGSDRREFFDGVEGRVEIRASDLSVLPQALVFRAAYPE